MALQEVDWDSSAESNQDARWKKLRDVAVLGRSDSGGNSGVQTLIGSREAVTSARTRDGVRLQNAVVLPPRRRSRRSFVATARWEGQVLERSLTYFLAEVVDLSDGAPSTAEFDLSEVAPHDVALCEPGALFYWTIGYETKESGQRSRSSVLMFRRSGPATPS